MQDTKIIYSRERQKKAFVRKQDRVNKNTDNPNDAKEELLIQFLIVTNFWHLFLIFESLNFKL